MVTVLEAWLAQRSVRAIDVQRSTVAELDRLFHTQLAAAPWPSQPWGDFVQAAGRQLDASAGDYGAFLLALVPDRDRGTGSLVEALAEILFVPRSDRTEYVHNRAGAPPWDIRRLLLEYAVWSLRVDEVLGGLTKGFCARGCDRLPTGCCSVLGYDMGMVPEAMLELQELEASGQGWQVPATEDKCKYHGPDGCCLRLFKSPACAGMLCDGLVQELGRRYSAEPLQAFLRPLARYRNHVLDRSAIFDVMALVVATGRRLLG
ncbi:MAG: hypothetical protein DRI90_05945 [Deltaproteobacteria bacterium]|nr:MAG: hypothetical protein DRI90_05945 [Deltaproteobacteria bacterium]